MRRLPIFPGDRAAAPPAFPGRELLAFRCTHCGNCCTKTIVPVAPIDVLRVSRATGLRPEKIIALYAPGAFLDGGRGLVFAQLDVGPRLLGLAQTAAGTCKFHDGERCRVYQDRPLVCRTFPFSVALSGEGQVESLQMKDALLCEYERDAAVPWPALERDCRRDKRQDRAWRRLVDGWNDRWAGGGRGEFLKYVGLAEPPPRPRG